MLLVPPKLMTRTVHPSVDLRLEYGEQGDASALPIVLLHGFTDSWPSWTGLLSHLPEAIRVLAPSQRGHGDSSRPASGYGVGDFADDVRRLLDALGVPRAVIAGHSMGSAVAQRFAIDNPERTAGLVLMGSTPSMRRNPAVAELWRTVSTLTDPIDPAFVTEFQVSTVARPTAVGLMDAAVSESLKVPAFVWRETLAGLRAMDHAEELFRIKAPTLIAWGTRDAMFLRNEQIAMQVAIPNARLLAYPGGGHAFHWEDPVPFAADLAAFYHSL